MSLHYEILKRLVKAVNIKKRWLSVSTEELLENRRKQNAKNRIPYLSDAAFEISSMEVNGCPVLKFVHKQRTDRANLFIIGGGMISAPHPGSVKKPFALLGRPVSTCSFPIIPFARTTHGSSSGIDF